MLSDLSSAGRVWAVLAVKPRKEETACTHFEREGFEVYCPRFKGRKLLSPVRPLFPGYLFVRLSPRAELVKARYSPGVIKPLLFGGMLACIEPEMVAFWKEREGGRGFLTPEPAPMFTAGQKVRFRSGAFEGLEGTVLEDLPAKERVRVLIDHLQRSIPVEADRDSLG